MISVVVVVIVVIKVIGNGNTFVYLELTNKFTNNNAVLLRHSIYQNNSMHSLIV